MFTRLLVAAFHSKWVIAGSIVFRSLYPDFSQFDACRTAIELDPFVYARQLPATDAPTTGLQADSATYLQLMPRKEDRVRLG